MTNRTLMYRYLIVSLFLTLAILQACQQEPHVKTPVQLWEELDADLAPFYYGVASGDPTQDQVIIWTKAVPSHHKAVNVVWTVSDRPDMSNSLYDGQVLTDSLSNYTVKVDVTDLDAGKTYYYQFEAEGVKSPVGRTKTFPRDDIAELKIAAVSCSNYEWGYFNAYEHLADEDLDVVLHLGDYIYEYGPGTYGDTTIGRFNYPPHEILTLPDYRHRYGQYRADSDLQKVHQQHPFITIWDDHEITNNAYTAGAQNHQDDEGDYTTRREIARQVYYEWMPIRDNEAMEHYRAFEIGDMASLIMLDERLEGRTEPAAAVEDISDDQKMLGAKQLSWFKRQLQDESTQWKIIGNQVIFSDMDLSNVYGMKVNLDAWDGYPSEKEEIIDYLREQEIANTVFLTGDTHCSWAFDIEDDSGEPVGVEIGATSISSANIDSYTTQDSAKMAERLIHQDNPHLRYSNIRDHGYVIITLSADSGKADYYYVDDLRSDQANKRLEKTINFRDNKIQL